MSVGGVLFGDSIDNYDNRQHEYEDKLLSDVYHSYAFADVPITAFVDGDGRIESVRCDNECIWQETNLIGLEYDKFVDIYSEKPDKVDALMVTSADGQSAQEQDVYDYDELGLQLWILDNKIVTVMATVYEAE